MKLSIITAAFNTEKYLEKCIRSLLDQDIPQTEYEIIVINDGSTDKSGEIAARLATEFANIRFISTENRGVSAARNSGLDVAQGEWIWCVDSDDWIEPNSLKLLTDYMADHKLDMLGIGRYLVAEDGTKNAVETYQTSIIAGRQVLSYQSINKQMANALFLFRNSLIKENNLRFMPGIYHEDTEFLSRLLYFSHRVQISNFLVYNNFMRQGSITRSINPKRPLDLIQVARSLYDFVRTHPMDSDARIAYNRVIGSALCSAMRLSREFTPQQRTEVMQLLEQNRQLTLAMMNRGSITHFTEGALCLLSPRLYYTVDKLIHK